MAIDEEILREAVVAIADVPGLHMDADDLVEDIYLLAYAFPEEGDFKAAVASTVRAMGQLSVGRVSASPLKHNFAAWSSYHYQPRVGQGARAVCRIVFRPVEGGIEVKGFGHRRIPKDFYERIAAGR
ncbi:MAG: hypothetical protein HFJ66_09495 [Eggerthellaceae bacterium]|nr:hypothetical protein [Eggerthellaceae bacterium]